MRSIDINIQYDIHAFWFKLQDHDNLLIFYGAKLFV